MNPLAILQEMQQKVESMLQNSPAKDVQSHIKSLMNNTFNKLDLVTREEFDIQKQVLQHTRAKLELIEKQLDEILNANLNINNKANLADNPTNPDNYAHSLKPSNI